MRDDIIFHITTKSQGNCMNLYVLGDLHMKSEAFLKHKWEKFCKIINNDPLAWTIFLGDLTEDDRPSTRQRRRIMFEGRHEAYTSEDRGHMTLMDNLVIPELMKGINPKRCLGMFDGDHYRMYRNGMTSIEYLCATKEINYLGDGEADIDIVFHYAKQVAMKCINARHGRGFNKTPALMHRRLELLADMYEGYDVLLRGHAHNPLAEPYSKFYRDRNNHIKSEKAVWLVNTMSFRGGQMRGKTDYAEEMEYRPTSYFLPVLLFSAQRHQEKARGNLKYKINIDALKKYI